MWQYLYQKESNSKQRYLMSQRGLPYINKNERFKRDMFWIAIYQISQHKVLKANAFKNLTEHNRRQIRQITSGQKKLECRELANYD